MSSVHPTRDRPHGSLDRHQAAGLRHYAHRLWKRSIATPANLVPAKPDNVSACRKLTMDPIMAGAGIIGSVCPGICFSALTDREMRFTTWPQKGDISMASKETYDRVAQLYAPDSVLTQLGWIKRSEAANDTLIADDCGSPSSSRSRTASADGPSRCRRRRRRRRPRRAAALAAAALAASAAAGRAALDAGRRRVRRQRRR